ncbi:MAG TPA: calcium/sodium antiporter, partial [Desulfobacteraceae bacterium]|nr:calcium/sodium antiporter [Desulfobacteraceae bacterium]
MTLNIMTGLIGLLMLYFGAEWLVKGSSGLARGFGLNPLVIGLTVVAFGTSAPELVVSIVSSAKGKGMIALGNIVGSNICNISLVLGLGALLYPIRSRKPVITRDIPIMLGVSLFLVILSLDSQLGRFEGSLLLSGIVLYTVFNYYVAVKESGRASSALETDVVFVAVVERIQVIDSRKKQVLLILAGIALVTAGAEALIRSSIKIMTEFGVSEKFIGLTIVAFGTSVSELAISVVAAAKKEMEISIGNLVGSNVFNILCVLGTATLVSPIFIYGGLVESGMLVDYLVMIVTSFLPWLMMRKGLTLT